MFADKWMFSDKNNNGKIDAPYDAWVDENRNGKQDKNELAVGDFELLREMGVNAIRWTIPTKDKVFYDPQQVNKPLLRDLYHRFGISVIAMDFFGAYTIGSGAFWKQGTDYTDPLQRQRMKDLVRAKVQDLKDEPFVLMWLLGNENNMTADYMGINAARTNANSQPVAYARFLNEVAQMTHEIDPGHPVGVGNIELDLIGYYRQYAPALNFIRVNSYRGEGGFGNLWQIAKAKFDRPLLITEYGCDVYAFGQGVDEEAQMQYHAGKLRDIIVNQAGGPYAGNAVGGIIFEYLDEWWKDTFDHPEDVH